MQAPGTDEPRGGERGSTHLTHLQRLEAESIHIMREAVAESQNPVMLYSSGKASSVMLRLALKAFHPSLPPFGLLHVDTTWEFQAVYAFRAKIAQETGMRLIVHQNPEAKAQGINPFDHGASAHTHMWMKQGLKQALDGYCFDAVLSGGRRDEQRARAKEGVFSMRSEQHRRDPHNQRLELWRLYNARRRTGESCRVLPLCNWTELDIWQYIRVEEIPIVPLYFAAPRPVVERDGALIMVDDDRMPLHAGEEPQLRSVRFATLGCYPLTGAVESEASTLTEVVRETLLTRHGQVIDLDASGSIESKQEGCW